MSSILVVQSSSQKGNTSVSRRVCDNLLDKLRLVYSDGIQIKTRECIGLPFIDEDFIAKSSNPLKHRRSPDTSADSKIENDEKKNENDRTNSTWDLSCVCCEELIEADQIIIAAPCYNFTIPACLKAWVDLVAVVKKTYTYGVNGPEGLLKDKTAYIIVSTGGADVGTAFDFGTRYLRHMLQLFGIANIVVIPVPRGETSEADSIIEKLAIPAEHSTEPPSDAP
jgi:FMN-dependent NADH-azoreductase